MGLAPTEALQSVVSRSVREADDLRHEAVGTSHLLLALLRECSGRAMEILAALNVDREEARSRILAEFSPGGETKPLSERPYTPSAVQALQCAMACAVEFEESELDADHLLVGLVSVNDGWAAKILEHYGVTEMRVRQEARRLRA
jgi:ATP-dependent Clp protease ATP-binding subunit ClpC